MSTSILISEETKRKLEAVKRDDETFDDLLDRLAVNRTAEDVRERNTEQHHGDDGRNQHRIHRMDETDDTRTGCRDPPAGAEGGEYITQW